MAKKKKKTTKKSPKVVKDKKTNSPFWRQAFAFILALAGFFIFLGGFGWGGSLPVGLFTGVAWLFGFAAYFSPIIIFYLAAVKLKNENHVIPFAKLIAATSILLMMAAIFHVFVAPENSAKFASEGSYGGQTGHAINSVGLGVLSSGTAFILYMVLMLIAFLFTFSIAPQRFMAFIAGIFKRKDKDTDLSELKSKASEEKKFLLKENVPVEHHRPIEEDKDQPRMTSFKNSAKKLSAVENHVALTAPSDPDWQFPSLDLLNQKQDKADAGDVQGNADIIGETLKNFKIDVVMEGANVGPRVTQFTLRPATGVKLNKIEALESNITYDLAASSIRIEAPIPGKRAVGIEVPNKKAATVRMSSIIASPEWRDKKGNLSFAIGKDIAGQAVVGNLEKLPHLLIAGQTGAGKSVMINTLLTSLLYANSPSDLKLIMVDPKLVELKSYNDIPHLLAPVITEPEKCISALKWAVAEMERRLRAMADIDATNIAEYNNIKKEEGMPYIVIVIDELSDLMMMAARDVEALIVRIAQKARAAGIHLVLATQRPSVDVITGLIKANVPGRIAFTTNSQVDSRTIIDQVGAEKLLGMGDMLYATPEMPKPKRIQGSLITKEEVMKVVSFLKAQRQPSYDDEVVSQPVQLNGKGGVVFGDMEDVDDALWNDVVKVVIETRKASTSYLQRRFRIGYSRAARLIEAMEEQGIVGPADGAKPREVLVNSIDDVFAHDNVGDEVYDDMDDDSGEKVNVRIS